MKLDFKRLARPLLCIIVGIVNLLAMLMSYASIFVSLYGDEDSRTVFSGFDSMSGGDESILNSLRTLFSAYNQELRAEFLLTVMSLVLMAMLAIGVLLILIGAFDMVRQLTGKKFIGLISDYSMRAVAYTMISAYSVMAILSSLLLFLSCIINMYTGRIFGHSITMGLKPGVGAIFIFILAFVAFFVYYFIDMNVSIDGESIPLGKRGKFMCAKCGSKVRADRKICGFCGGNVIPRNPRRMSSEKKHQAEDEHGTAD